MLNDTVYESARTALADVQADAHAQLATSQPRA
jgi:hypothetical protein